MKRVLSFGAGVQSTTLLLMACRGVLPKFDYVVFADTGWEPEAVYSHLEWCKGEAAKAGMTIHVVSNGNIFTDAMNSQIRGTLADGKRWVSMPYHLLSPTGSAGMIRRQCTKEYKVQPIEEFCRRNVMGLQPRQRAPKEPVILKFMGISLDEAGRMKPSYDRWQTFVYPFCQSATHHPEINPLGTEWNELGRYYTRADCKVWLAENYPSVVVPRSACLGCPFHSDAEWREIKSRPEEWGTVVQLDRYIREAEPEQRGMMRNQPYLHRSRVDIDKVDFSRGEDAGQLNWLNECEGMCGV